MFIHKPRIHMQPMRCISRACAEFNKVKYLPFKNKRLLKDADPNCQVCKSMFKPCSIIHLLMLDENGPVQGSVESSPGSFCEHPIKRWNFYCKVARENFKENNVDNPEYPHFMTVVADAATCYECLEAYCKTLEDPNSDQEKLMGYFNSKE